MSKKKIVNSGQWLAGHKPWNKLEIPDRTLLESLYCDQQLTTNQIAEQMNVTGVTVGKWLKRHGISTRPAGIGLLTRGQKLPTKSKLNRMIHNQNMTYQEVADLYGVDLTAVPYWLDKYGLPRPQRLTFAEKYADPESQQMIKSLYDEGLSLRRIGEKFNVTGGVISKYLREIGGEIRSDGWDGGKRHECKDGHLVRSSYELRVDNWLYKHGIEHTYEPRLPFDQSFCADFLANGWYIEVWGVTNNASYDERKAHKEKLYARHDAPLIGIPVHAFYTSNNRLWERLLKQCLSSPK